MTLSIWHNYLLAFNDLCLTIYGLPSSEKQTLLPLQTIQYNVSRRVRELVEVQAIDTTTKLLVAFTSDMVFAIDLAADFTSTESNSTTPFIMILKLISINEMSYNDESQWYSLLAGSSGYRILWMSSLEDANLRYEPVTVTLTLLSATLSGLSRDNDEDFTKDEQHFDNRLKLTWQPSAPVALTAFPRLDFDDALGLVVMGNMFGELALVDYVGVRLEEIWSISQDIFGCPGGSWDLSPVPVVRSLRDSRLMVSYQSNALLASHFAESDTRMDSHAVRRVTYTTFQLRSRALAIYLYPRQSTCGVCYGLVNMEILA